MQADMKTGGVRLVKNHDSDSQKSGNKEVTALSTKVWDAHFQGCFDAEKNLKDRSVGIWTEAGHEPYFEGKV